MNGFKLRHQCGAVYHSGNLEFSKDGNSLLSSSGSRVNLYDLASQTSRTVTAQARSNLSQLCLSADQQVLLQIDHQGYAQLVLLKNDSVLSYLNFHEPVSVCRFNHDGKFLALGLGAKLKIFSCAFHNHKFLGTLLPHLSFSAWHSQQITHLAFHKTYLITSSADQTVRVCNLEKGTGFLPITLTGHRKPVLGSYPEGKHLFTVSSDARVFVWEWEAATDKFLSIQAEDYMRRLGKKPALQTNTEQLTLKKKHQLQHEGAFTLSCVHMQGGLLVAGFKTGNFAVYSISIHEVSVLHTLSMSEFEITAVALNNSGDWVAFGSQTLGQLLVWEWKSETYVLKQSGHSSALLSAAFTADSHVLATGGTDGKIKLWEKGLCFATFTDHSHAVVDLMFCKTNTLVSCSKDGTVRAFDTARYKQFRVFTTAGSLEFLCLGCDKSGEIVAAGASSYEVYVWALPTGVLCDVLSGHSGPVTSVSFLPSGTAVTGSWDKTLRIWDILEGKGGCETIDVSGQVLAVAGRGDGKQVAASLGNGEISVWTLSDLQENYILECRRDAAGGRGVLDRFTAKSNPNNKRFNSLAYSPDGNLLLAAGNSKYLCIYDLKHRVLFHKVSFTENRSLSGTLHKLNSKQMTEAGPKSEFDIDDFEVERDVNHFGVPDKLRPGKLDNKPLQVRASKVVYSGTGRTFGVVTTEGLLVYSVDSNERWMPMGLDVEISKSSVIQSLVKEEYTTALVTSLMLGEEEISKGVVNRIPLVEITNVVRQIGGNELIQLIVLLGKEVVASVELGFLMVWVKEICRLHSQKLRGRTEIRSLLRNLSKKFQELAWMTQENTYLLQHLAR